MHEHSWDSACTDTLARLHDSTCAHGQPSYKWVMGVAGGPQPVPKGLPHPPCLHTGLGTVSPASASAPDPRTLQMRRSHP